MGDDQERRISTLEQHIERLYGTTRDAGERLAVMESQMKTMADGLKEARRDFAAHMAAMQGDLKQSMAEQQRTAHNRTVLAVTLILGVVTIASNLIIPFISSNVGK